MAEVDYISQQYGSLRNRARQQAQSQSQAEKEGIERRFAQLGQMGSGAQLRLEAQAADRGSKRLQDAEEQIGFAELGERQRQKEVKEGREFITGERLGGQEFAAGQALEGRKFATSERLGSQDFVAGQALEGRKFATSEREAGQAYGLDVLGKQQEFAKGERLGSQEFATTERQAGQKFQTKENILSRRLQTRALDLQQKAYNTQVRQFEKEFDRDSAVIAFNQRMSEDAADDPGFFGSVAKDIKRLWS